jgi:hypothetical protein
MQTTTIRKFRRDEDSVFTLEELRDGSFRLYDSKLRLVRELLDIDEWIHLKSHASLSGFVEVSE